MHDPHLFRSFSIAGQHDKSSGIELFERLEIVYNLSQLLPAGYLTR